MAGALMFLWILSSAPQAAAIDAPISQAESLFRAGKEDEAKRIITQYITNHENVAGYIAVGNLYARLQKWPDSVHYLSIGSERDPKSALVWYELGLAQHQNKQVDDAISSLRRSLQISSATGKTYLALGQILELAGDRYDARTIFMASITKTGDSALARSRLCWLAFRDDLFADAVRECQMAVRLNPQDDNSWAVLGRAYYENHQKTEAFSTFQKTLSARPHSAINYRARGLIYLDEKSYEQASADLGRAFGLDAHDDEAAIGLARSVFESGHYAEALPLYIDACKLNRDYRFELLARQRELSRKNKDDLADSYEAAVDQF